MPAFRIAGFARDPSETSGRAEGVETTELGIPDTKMTFLAYLTLAVALLSLPGRETRGWLARATPQRELAVRLGALAAGIAGLLAGSILFEQGSGLALLVFASLAAGGTFFALGAILWRGRAALVLRAVGWSLGVAAAAVPSLLTLALPAAALLVVALGRAPEQTARSTAQPASS
jgi:hypothetical protein